MMIGGNKMSIGQFIKRRLIRLHPMIIVGMVVGAICFYFSASPELFPIINSVPVWKLLLIMFIGFFLLPVPVSMDIRGWQEMYPLNGPAWSLFFEYIANIFYALVLRRLGTKALTGLVIIAGVVLAHYVITSHHGDIIGGWSITAEQLRIGFTRLAYPFLAGLLLRRIFKPIAFNNAFLWCSVLIVIALAMPRVGGSGNVWMNGLYEAAVILLLFPLIVFLGASGTINGKRITRICNFLGQISYPIYIVHYPLLYVFYAWVVNNKVPLADAWGAGALVFAGSILIAWLSVRLYDIPVRKWLRSVW